MNADPHSRVLAAWPYSVHVSSLDSYGCHEGIAGPRKCEEESVTLRVDLNALVRVERLTDYSAMFRYEFSVKVAEPLQQHRRGLYVAEYERDCARG
jgi:hypothetical protein